MRLKWFVHRIHWMLAVWIFLFLITYFHIYRPKNILEEKYINNNFKKLLHREEGEIYAGNADLIFKDFMKVRAPYQGDNRIFEAVFKEAGIISTFSAQDFIQYLRVFSYGIIPNGNKIAIVTDSGGSGSMMCRCAPRDTVP